MPKKHENKEYEKKLVIPVERKMWQELRKMAFYKETSMNEIVRECLNKLLKKC